MPIIKLTSHNLDRQLAEIAEVILRGGVVLMPTDTIYGLSALATDEIAISRILSLKGRHTIKPFICLVDSLEMAENYAIISAKCRKYLLAFWPGPVSIILPSRFKLPSVVQANLPTIALRWPRLSWLRQLIHLVGQPIVSTSANLVGEPPLTDITMVSQYFAPDKLDLIVDGGRLKNSPSSLIDLTGSQPRVIR